MEATAMTYVQVGLQRLDLLIHREILRLRAQYQLSLDEFRGLYVSDEQVDHLVNESLAEQGADETVNVLTERAEALRAAQAERRLHEAPWARLWKEFRLSQFEHDVVLLVLAPHVQLKYETLFAYLNNDVTRKSPTCDLALRLFTTTHAERAIADQYLLPQSTLFKEGLLQTVPQAADRPSWLSTGFTLAPGLAHFLLGHEHQIAELVSTVETREPRLGWDDVPLGPDLLKQCRKVGLLFTGTLADTTPPVVLLEGREGTGAPQVAEALCRDLGVQLIVIDAERLRPMLDQLPKIVRHLILQQRLTRAGIFIEHVEGFLDKEGQLFSEGKHFLIDLAQKRGLMLMSSAPGVPCGEWLREQDTLTIRLKDPDVAQRQKLWEQHLAPTSCTVDRDGLATLAARFILTPEQIRRAVASAAVANAINDDPTHTGWERELFRSAKEQSAHSLAKLAVKVEAIHTWDDLVLIPATMKRVKDVAGAIKHRHLVYGQWGFHRRLGTGMGLKVLFAGTSGTGKTMTAGVIARDLGLELYKIDLQGVVSKYIGETEKNLERIFRAAYCSNAILFFDEADALFGKRSEVKDAHDRYANIEVSYLLQKMEDFDGVVILASNWSKNIDEAFARRMHYVVDFPLPDETQRAQLWQGMLPSELPLSPDVDLEFLAKQFPITGGDIKNVVLDAAFVAAQNGQIVTMNQLIQAMARQQIKQGRIPSTAEFKQHYATIAQD
jgi:SpoVK/Ycf46/Vps4 family AAA+-type ATPase